MCVQEQEAPVNSDDDDGSSDRVQCRSGSSMKDDVFSLEPTAVEALCNYLACLREINRKLDIELPTSGPRTINGLILEHLEMIPEAGTSLKINDYPLEIMQTKDKMVKTVRIRSASDNTAPENPSG